MPARKETSFEFGGDTVRLSASEIKTLKTLTAEMMKVKNTTQAYYVVRQKIAKMDVEQSKRNKAEEEYFKRKRKNLIEIANAIKRAQVETFRQASRDATNPPRAVHFSPETQKMFGKATGRSADKEWEKATGGKATGGSATDTPKGFLAIFKKNMQDKFERPMLTLGAYMVGVWKTFSAYLKDSKHISMINEHIHKALGLLIDLVLLPFLPLIVWGIVQLYKAVITAGNWWRDLVKLIGVPLGLTILATGALLALLTLGVIKAVVELAISAASAAIYAFLTSGTVMMSIKAAVSWLLAPITGALGGFLTWLTALFAAGGVSAALAIGIAVALGIAAGAVMIWFLQLFGVFDNISKMGESFRTNFGRWFETLPPPIKMAISLLKSLFEALANVINLIPGMNILTSSKMNEMITNKSYSPEIMAKMRTKYGQDVSYSADTGYTQAGAAISSYAAGGVVPGTGAQVAVVHGGETITPSGKAGNVTFNFYGYQDDKFIAKVREVLRQDATRYSQ